ncbi:hypothetical protein [Rhizobium leguminosarum]|uniref:hypothetical protein n=1 Tax=Rhizobium leguminosarum TaxID=384 RepID=UPI00103E1EE0|nr:hypothetical protein [Rhizobium leguminosarum]TBZ14716.1 hypothetical protein E0H33_15535 [Rhizobium leguminosarum bv. viciae]
MSLNDTLEARHLPGRVTPVGIRRADETGFKTLQIGYKPVQSRDLLISVKLHDSRASTKFATKMRQGFDTHFGNHILFL